MSSSGGSLSEAPADGEAERFTRTSSLPEQESQQQQQQHSEEPGAEIPVDAVVGAQYPAPSTVLPHGDDNHEHGYTVEPSCHPVCMVSCALLALLVPGVVGSLLTIAALPGCLSGRCKEEPSDGKGNTCYPPTKSPATVSASTTSAAATISATGTAYAPATPSTAATASRPGSTTAVAPPAKVFTRGKLYYRSAYIDNSGGRLFVGAMEKLFRLQLDDISSQNVEELDLPAPSSSVTLCGSYTGQHMFGKDVDCRNHIREVHPIRDGSTLYVCGTNARAPTDWQVRSADLTVVPVADQVTIGGNNETGQAQSRCPFYVYQSGLSLWLDDAPLNDTSSVVSLGVLSTSQYGFFRSGVYTAGSNRPIHGRLASTDVRAVQKPITVAAFSTAEHAFFVFREEGLERSACGPRNVSTVARLCKNEIGVSRQNADRWTTLMKARLQCVDPADDTFSFNEIYASSWVPNLENGVLFGAFVTETRSWRSSGHYDSAVCAFLLDDIEREFNGTSSFYELTLGGNYRLSQPVPLSQVPTPRPGVACPSGPRTLSATDTRFWEEHPLITRAPPPRHGRAFFVQSGIAFRSLVTFVLDETWGKWVVCYVATEQGAVLKLAEEQVTGGQVPAPAKLVDTFNATTEPIRKMLASLERRSLYVFTDADVHQYRLDACEGRHTDCPSCLQDPFCGWDGSRCLPHTVGMDRLCTEEDEKLRDHLRSTTSCCSHSHANGDAFISI